MSKIWKWIEHNRFLVLAPIVAITLWAYAIGCTPLTTSPLDPGLRVNVKQLDLEFKKWQAQQEIVAGQFKIAAEDLAEQKANNDKIKELILGLASGGIPDTPGLIKLLVAGGGLGAIIDNIRKGGVIGGLKKKTKKA